jgi:hypothetical protein
MDTNVIRFLGRLEGYSAIELAPVLEFKTFASIDVHSR